MGKVAENVVSYSVDLALKSEVAQPEAVTVYLTEHENVVDSKNASGEVILLNGGRKQVITLSPSGDNSLKGEGVTLEKNAKAIVKIKVPALGEEQVRFAF